MNERVTVTLPEELVQEIDRRFHNRSTFIVRSVRHELDRRRREELRRSLRSSHPEGRMFADAGTTEWLVGLPDGDEDLVDPADGQAVRWIPGTGWVTEYVVSP